MTSNHVISGLLCILHKLVESLNMEDMEHHSVHNLMYTIYT